MKLSNGKRKDIWTVIRTILEKSPGIQAKYLVEKVIDKTGLGRSSVYTHLHSFRLRGQIHTEKWRYYLTGQLSTVGEGATYKHITPKIRFWVTQRERDLPGVGFNMINDDYTRWRVKVEVRALLGGRNLGLIKDKKGYYDGSSEHLFEPGEGFVNGSFSVPAECVQSKEELTIEVRVTTIDDKNRTYKLFPKSWTYIRSRKIWYFEPKAFTDGNL